MRGKTWTWSDVVRTSHDGQTWPPGETHAGIARAGAVLDSFRESWPELRLTSWYRSPAINEAVGGVPNSAHPTGRGLDLGCSAEHPVVAAAKELKKRGVLREALYHDSGHGPHLHVTVA